MVLFVIFPLISGIVLSIVYCILLALGLDGFEFIIGFFPVMGLAVGFCVSCFAAKGAEKGNVRYTKALPIATALFGFLLLFLLTYYGYFSMYVDSKYDGDIIRYYGNYDINHLFVGDHISEFEVDGEQVTFGKYMQIQFFDATISITDNGSNPNNGIRGLGTIAYILNYVETLVIAIMSFVDIKNMHYCDNCKKYYKKKVLEDYSSVNDCDEIYRRINEYAEDPSKLPAHLKKSGPIVMNATLNYCPKCMQGKLVINSTQKSGNRSILQPIKEYDIDNDTVKVLYGIADRK